jgi:hypothetical protein
VEWGVVQHQDEHEVEGGMEQHKVEVGLIQNYQINVQCMTDIGG